MELGQQKEQFSFAYVRAIAATAGFSVSEPSVDDDSIDLVIASREVSSIHSRPRLELQVKCTAGEVLTDDHFKYPLKRKNYDDLRDPNVCIPRILVVVRVPNALDEWAVATDEELALRRCGYWCSLRGMDYSENATRVSVSVPRNHRFTVEGLRAIMDCILQGEQP